MIRPLLLALILAAPIHHETEPNSFLPGSYGGPNAAWNGTTWWPSMSAFGRIESPTDRDVFFFPLGIPWPNAVQLGAPLAICGEPGKFLNVAVIQTFPWGDQALVAYVSGPSPLDLGHVEFCHFPNDPRLWSVAVWGEPQSYEIRSYP